MINEVTYELFFNALIHGDKRKSKQIVDELITNTSIIEIYENLIKKALYTIGFMWEENKISVSTEHLSSAIVESIINDLYEKIVKDSRGEKKILLACVEDEFHQIGIKMISDIFEINGWNTFLLGANTPIVSVIEYAKELNPDIIALSMSMFFHMPKMEMMIDAITKEYKEVPIIIGGQGFSRCKDRVFDNYINVRYFEELKIIEKFVVSISEGI